MSGHEELGSRQIAGFEVLRPIGRGGMGVAYLAKQTSLGRLVVLKFLGPDPEVDPVEQAARFRREAEIMAKLSHPNIVTIFDFGVEDGHPFLVMEYVEEGDLRRRMRQGVPMAIDRVRALLRPLVGALEYLHQHGILHRDLKPENILMHREDTPKVSDFGIAVAGSAAGSLTHPTHALGTIGYVAPEQQYRLRVDERTDQYSLAALTYEMLTGQLPLGAFPPPSRLNRRVHPSADAVILRALSEDRADRFATIREYGDALDRALATPRRRRRRLVLSAAAVALLASGIVGLRSGADGLTFSSTAPKPHPRDRVATPSASVEVPGESAHGPDSPGAGRAEARKTRPGPGPLRFNSLGMSFVTLPAGEFLMGSPDTDPAARPDEKPRHLVRIEAPFEIGAHEVTVGQFRIFADATGYKTKAEVDGQGGGSFDPASKKLVRVRDLNWRNPGLWKPQADEEPVVQVTWDDAVAFCRTLSSYEGLEYRLPTESEWEYACRAGSTGRWSFGDDPSATDDYAWTRTNSGFTTHSVGTKRPNGFGLFDMHGNAWEWCLDRYVPDYASHSADPPKDPGGVDERVLRGGSWDNDNLDQIRSAARLHVPSGDRYTTFGFRVRRAQAPSTHPPGRP